MTTYRRNGAFSVTLAILYFLVWLFLSCALGLAVAVSVENHWLGLVVFLLPLIGTLANVGAPVAGFISRRATFGPDAVVITGLLEASRTIPYADIAYVEMSRGGDIYVWGAAKPVVAAKLPKRKSKRILAHAASRPEHVLYHSDRFTFWELTGLGRAIAERAGKPFQES